MRTRTLTAWLAVLALAAPLNAHAEDHDHDESSVTHTTQPVATSWPALPKAGN